MHPLVGELSGLSIDELNLKINELTKKANQAYRMGYSDAQNQLQMILEGYHYELSLRNMKAMEEIQAKLSAKMKDSKKDTGDGESMNFG
jgi:hypothetical protein